MAFNQSDQQAQEAATALGVQIDSSIPADPDTAKITLGPATSWQLSGTVLANCIEAVDRFKGNGLATTVWLNVTATNIPTCVKDAIDQCKGTGIAIIVTHNGQSTHEPTAGLDPALIESVKKASRGGSIWHPLAGRKVQIQ